MGIRSELSRKKQNIQTKPKTAACAKVIRPVFTGIFPRKRLFKLLDTGRQHSCIWISGPPGAGKTVLASSYMDARARPCLWYQVDCRDADAATFFYYMGRAVNKTFPRTKPLPLLTPEYLPGLPAFTRNYFERLSGRLKTPFYIVFDNYQEIPVNSPVHEMIRNGIEVMPNNVRVIFISRTEPPKTFARLQTNNSLKMIGWNELALTLNESKKIIDIKLKGRKTKTRNLALKLHQIAGGWMAGLALMIEKAKREVFEFEPEQLRAVAQDTVFDYFASEIFEKLDPVTRDFLLKTALPPSIDAAIAKQLTGTGNADQILSQLYRNNHFMERRFHAGTRVPIHVYQYHPLFREFLLHYAKNYLDDEFVISQKKAALILSEKGRYEDAFGLFRDCMQWERIELLIMEHGRELIAQGRGKLLEEWITSLPKDNFDNGPWLQYNLGLCRMSFNPAESRSHLERAFRLFEKRKDRVGVFLSWAGIVDSCIFGFDNLKLLDGWIPRLGGLIRSFGAFPSEETEARVASSMFMALIYRQPQHPEIEKWGARALELSQKSGDMRLKALALLNYAFHKLNSGRLEEAAITIDSCRRFTQSGDAPPLVVLTLNWVEAMHLTYSANNKDCQKVVSGGINLSASTGAHIMDFLLLGQGALSALDAGDLKTAEKLFGRMDFLSFRQDPLTDKGYYQFLLAYNAMLRRDFRQAAMHADMAMKQAEATGFPLATSYCHIEYAHVMHELKENKKAAYHLKEAQRIASLIRYRYMEFICLLTRAQFAFGNGKEKSGLSSLRKGMALGRDCGFMNTYTLRPEIVAGLCSKAFEAGIETEYVQALIKKRNFSSEAAPVDMEAWPRAVKIYTFGKFVIERDGRPVKASRKTQQRPLNLLKALIALGAEGVKKQTLADILWPDAEGDSQQKSFAAALHRLRGILGHENTVRLSGGRVTLNPLYVWVDVRAFEHILEKAEAAFQTGRKEKAASLRRKAAALYHGPFLAGDDMPVVDSLRKRLRDKFNAQREACP